LTFIIPYWKASDFLAATPDDLAQWFEVFDVFIAESPDDRGILFASKDSLDHVLTEILEKMRQDGEPHPVFDLERKQPQ